MQYGLTKYQISKKVLSVLLILFLTGCDSGGNGSVLSSDSGGDGNQSNPDPLPGELPDPQELQGTGELQLSGTLTAPLFSFIDRDTNDVETPSESNDTPQLAQPLPNRAIIHGFASDEPTDGQGSGSVEAERFSAVADENDYYIANLQAGQSVVLQVVDFTENPTGTTYSGDLDLCIFNRELPISLSNPFTCATSEREFERLDIEISGEYLINVTAFSGISKYVLRLLPAENSALISTPVVTPIVTISGASTRVNESPIIPGQVIVGYKPESTLAREASITSEQPMLIQLAGSDSDDITDAELLNRLMREVSEVDSSITARSALESGLADWSSSAAQYKQTMMDIKRIRQHPDVEYASPNYWRYATATPNDSLYNRQYHYRDIQLPQAWDVETGENPAGGDVIVAVLDTGVFLDHPDLAPNLVPGFDFISSTLNSNDGDGIDSNPDDPGDSVLRGASSWHGTHVAGTVAAASNNVNGVAGTSWGAKIMPIRVLGIQGGTSFDIIQGMRYAAGLVNNSGTFPSQRADILNLSLGSSGSSAAEQAAINEIRQQGVVIVAAAGNDNNSSPSYPAAYDNVVSVSAIGPDRNLAYYSNFGPTIDVAAPGGDLRTDRNLDGTADGVMSTYVDDSSGRRVASYNLLQGTSMATPHVAGVFALMKARDPNLDAADFDNLLISGEITDDAGDAGRDDQFGHGIINAFRAVNAANGVPVPPQPVLAANPDRISFDSNEAGSKSFEVSNLNSDANDPLSVDVEIIPDSAQRWLSIDGEAFSSGSAAYTATIDRGTLADGIYDATVRLIPDSGSTLEVPVTMLVGDVDKGGELVQQYVMLIDPETRGVLAETKADLETGAYLFKSLPRRDYRIVAGSDIDVDLFICQNGETCGSYPSRGAEQTVTLDQDRDELDFIVSIVASFEGSNAANESVASAAETEGVQLDTDTRDATQVTYRRK